MKFKPSLKQTIRDNNGGHAFYGALTGKPVPEMFQNKPEAETKPREPRKKSDPSTLEASVMTDLATLYHIHPNILFAVRQTSGGTKIGDHHVMFWRWLRRNKAEMTITDTWGVLRDGRFFAIEAKKPGWKGVGTGDGKDAVRERKQQAFIDVVKSAGGVGGFVTCAEQALEILNG